MREISRSHAWDAVRGQRAVRLTTFRVDGRAVPTTVGYGIVGRRLFFMTDETSGKVKRLRRTPRVEVAASTLRGAVRGPAVAGAATRLVGADAEQAQRVITSTNRLAWFFLLRRARRDGRVWATYAVEPTASPDSTLPETPTHESSSKEHAR